MDEIETAVREVQRGIKLHRRNIVCRALMWDAIVHAVTNENVIRVLDALAPGERSYLLGIYDTFPPSLWSGNSPDESTRRAVIDQWCQQHTANE